MHKLFFRVIFLLLAIAVSVSAHSETSFGTRADQVVININSIPEPTLSHSKNSFVTVNSFGFDVLNTESNWVVADFLKNITPGMTVLDVGTGYGTLTRSALSKQATVVSNDLSMQQLLYHLKHTTPLERKRLFLNNKDIRTVHFPENSFDLIMFHRVLHFLKGHEIEEIFKKSIHWLKPNGKIFIVMMSKDHVAFRDKVHYDTTKSWPGEELVFPEQHLPEQAYALPKTLHVISAETLETQLRKLGFTIEKSDYVSLKKFGSEKNRDGKEAVGVIACKPKQAPLN